MPKSNAGMFRLALEVGGVQPAAAEEGPQRTSRDQPGDLRGQSTGGGGCREVGRCSLTLSNPR